MSKRGSYLYKDANIRALDIAYDLVVRRRTGWLNSIDDLHRICYFVCGVYKAELSKSEEIVEPAKAHPFSVTVTYQSIINTISKKGDDDWQLDQEYIFELGLADYDDAPTLFELIPLADEQWRKIGSELMIDLLEKDLLCPRLKHIEYIDSMARGHYPPYPGVYAIDREKDVEFFKRILRREVFGEFFSRVMELQSRQ